MNRHITRAAVLPLLVLCSGNAGADWQLDTSIALQYNDNLPNASLDQDIRDGTAFDFRFSPGIFSQLSGYSRLSITADLDVIRQFDYQGLDSIAAGVTGALRRKFGLGPHAPWMRISGSAGHLDFKDNQRDGWSYSAVVEAGKLLTQRLSVMGSYRYERRRADDSEDIPFLVNNFGIRGDAFDTDAHNLGINGQYEINSRLSLILGYTCRTGSITATTLRNNEIFAASDAISADPVFGPDRFAYRIEADTSIFTVGLSMAVNDSMSVNFNYTYQDSDAYEDLAYSNNLVRLDLLYSY